MSDINKGMTLRSRIREDYLTCAICFNEFTHPKALPCIHTFCLECLRGYVKSSVFPCPVCRADATVPPQGLEGFPDNYMVSSLQDTVEEANNKPAVPQRPSDEAFEQASANKLKPVPAPRSISPKSSGDRPVPAPRSVSPRLSSGTPTPTLPPRLKSVSPTPTHANNSNEVDKHTQQQRDSSGYNFGNIISDGIGGVVGAVGSAISDISGYLQVSKPKPAANTPTSPFEYVPQSDSGDNPVQQHYPGLYPQLATTENKGPCTDRMVLSFGKFGPGVNDFMKPFGLATGKNGEFVLSDRAGNRIFVFSNTGELKSRFNTNCSVNDVAITKENNIMIAVSKSGSAIMRMYSMEGRCLHVFGDYYKFDISSGITVTPSNHVAITNLAADNVLIFTEQRKFSIKFGWKGRGQNHFTQPYFVASTSKDYLVVSDTGNDCIKLFDVAGNFKRSFGSKGDHHSQLNTPLGVATDAEDNIIIADSGNFRVEIFTSKGSFYSTLIKETNLIGPDVKPINVAVTPKNNIAVLLCGTGYCEVRVFNWKPHSYSGFTVECLI
ncbi:tripartite motif-containing protein 2-like [Mercenaria mercenaria]|uniref:tripartite motif-containing protein 2-like n=1 Tax=Mercenaria mercenaria TaxID=6596 RepID=UPI00234F6898|nr:tripartite motif-containing protein 2-like [Mercenaria mercenaria]XP_053382708.1 tripartite motif-containing protein 2-like [Mercenaria mercenaria]